MTSDAKIGLLLGLIFIFVIAFVINGLPSLRPQTTKGEPLPANVMPAQDENLGVADTVQKAQETIQWEELLDQQTEEPRGPVTVTKSVELTTAPQPEQTLAADNAGEGVRSLVPMPSAEGIEKLTKGLEDVVQTLVQASNSAAAQEKTTEPAPSVDVARSEPRVDLKPERTQAAADSTPSASSPAMRTYTVVEGDTLASVAKKAYGPEEGNRIINNQRIFEANRNILKTANDIVPGQELVIPPPAKPKPKPEAVMPKTLFEKVEAIGKRQVPAPDRAEAARQTPSKTESAKPSAARKEPAKTTTSERWYVVQDGDNLWKIASIQLGKGTRHEEIAKLNADILKGDIKVNPGMRLRLPSQ